jgi:hypothetical protein
MSSLALPRRVHTFALAAAAAATLAGALSVPAIAAKPQGGGGAAGTANCVLAAAGVGQTLTVNGTGYAPNTSFRVQYIWPNSAGTSDTGVWSDATGAIYGSSYAYWSGRYTVNVYGTSGSKPLLATCSLTVA